MTEPCRALMGYVPGRYVEHKGGQPRPLERRCRWCDKRMEPNARNSTCSEDCAEALVDLRRGNKPGRKLAPDGQLTAPYRSNP